MQLVIDPDVTKHVAVGAVNVICLLLAYPSKAARVRAIRLCRFLLAVLSVLFVVVAAGYALQPEAFVNFFRAMSRNTEIQRYVGALGHPAAVMAVAGTFVGFFAQVFHAILDLANRITVSKTTNDTRPSDDRRDGSGNAGESSNSAK